MKYKVNETCIGCGLCTGLCPSLFQMGDLGQAEAEERDVFDDELSDAQNALESCPVSAIESYE